MWASDFPHWDGSLEALAETKQAIAALSPQEQQLVLGDNVAQIYKLS
jgi:predicted TIM-barrel fold metal-dependent hydrolase